MASTANTPWPSPAVGVGAIGATLGISDDAAQKRVSRALERLHTGLTSRGVTTTAGALSALLAANTVSFAPAGLAATLSTAALAGTTLATAATATATKAIAMTTLQKTLVTAIVAACAATPILVQHRSLVRLREQNQVLQRQGDQLSQLASENERLSNLVAQANSTRNLPTDEFSELLRLRGEVGVLRNRTRDLEKFVASLPSGRQTPAQPPEVPPEDNFPSRPLKKGTFFESGLTEK